MLTGQRHALSIFESKWLLEGPSSWVPPSYLVSLCQVLQGSWHWPNENNVRVHNSSYTTFFSFTTTAFRDSS